MEVTKQIWHQFHNNQEAKAKIKEEVHRIQIESCNRRIRIISRTCWVRVILVSPKLKRHTKDSVSYKWVKIQPSNSVSNQCNKCQANWLSSSSNNFSQMVDTKCNLNLKYTLLRNSKSFMEFHQNVLQWFSIMVNNNLIKDLILAADKQ